MSWVLSLHRFIVWVVQFPSYDCLYSAGHQQDRWSVVLPEGEGPMPTEMSDPVSDPSPQAAASVTDHGTSSPLGSWWLESGDEPPHERTAPYPWPAPYK